jgi:hypothetical protein
MSASIRFYREGGHEAVAYLGHGESKSRLITFCQRIQQYTTASINWASATAEIWPDYPESEGDFQSLDHYAFLWFRDSAKQMWAFKLFSPKIGIFEEQPEGDLIVLPEKGVQIASWYSDLAGKTLTYERGAFCGSSRSH